MRWNAVDSMPPKLSCVMVVCRCVFMSFSLEKLLPPEATVTGRVRRSLSAILKFRYRPTMFSLQMWFSISDGVEMSTFLLSTREGKTYCLKISSAVPCVSSPPLYSNCLFALLFQTSGQLIFTSISSAISLASVLTELNPISLNSCKKPVTPVISLLNVSTGTVGLCRSLLILLIWYKTLYHTMVLTRKGHVCISLKIPLADEATSASRFSASIQHSHHVADIAFTVKVFTGSSSVLRSWREIRDAATVQRNWLMPKMTWLRHQQQGSVCYFHREHIRPCCWDLALSSGPPGSCPASCCHCRMTGHDS